MTREDFENGYAERSGVTVEWLHEQNQYAIPCDCGDDLCQGWQMVNLTPDMFEKYYAESRKE